jgi:hypothetical protein
MKNQNVSPACDIDEQPSKKGHDWAHASKEPEGA